MWGVGLGCEEAVPAVAPSRCTSEMILDRQARDVGRLKSAEAAARLLPVGEYGIVTVP